MTAEERFWSNVHVADGGCWEWQRSKNKTGHGRVSWQRRTTYAHRVSWELMNGTIPDGLFVLHRCDNPPCVNPEHLFLGTQLDNVRDCINKQRFRPGVVRGQDSPLTKLTNAEVIEMRRLHGDLSYNDLARRYEVSKSTVARIITGKKWTHLIDNTTPDDGQRAFDLLTKGLPS